MDKYHMGWSQCFDDAPLYCEAHHTPEDVIYSGSEDDYYDSSAQRKQRYAEQAQRFLDGKLPVLLSASLRGPFSRESGWSNPWMGQGGRVVQNGAQATLFSITASNPDPQPEQPLSVNQAEFEVVNQGTTEEPSYDIQEDSLQTRDQSHQVSFDSQRTNLYPLPSPPISINPYMNDAAFARVRNWRDEVRGKTAAKDEFWLSGHQTGTTRSSKKRQADHEWLHKKMSKRRKFEGTEPPSITSPSRRVLQNRPSNQQSTVAPARSSTTTKTLNAHLRAQRRKAAKHNAFMDATLQYARWSAFSSKRGMLTTQASGLSIANSFPSFNETQPVVESNTKPTAPAKATMFDSTSYSANLPESPRMYRRRRNDTKSRDEGLPISQPEQINTGEQTENSKIDSELEQAGESSADFEEATSKSSPELTGTQSFKSQLDASFYFRAKRRPSNDHDQPPESKLEEMDRATQPLDGSVEDHSTENCSEATGPSNTEPVVRAALANGHGSSRDDIELSGQELARDENSMILDETTIVTLGTPVPRRYADVKGIATPQHAVSKEPNLVSKGDCIQVKCSDDFEVGNEGAPERYADLKRPDSGGDVMEGEVPSRYARIEASYAAQSEVRPLADISKTSHHNHSRESSCAEDDIGGTTLLPSQENVSKLYSELKSSNPIEKIPSDGALVTEAGSAQDTMVGMPMQQQQLLSPSCHKTRFPSETSARSNSIPGLPSLSSIRKDTQGQDSMALEDAPEISEVPVSAPFLEADAVDNTASSTTDGESEETPSSARTESPRLETQEQSPWAAIGEPRSTQKVAEKSVDETDICGRKSAGGEDTFNNIGSQSQSPWAKEAAPPGQLPPLMPVLSANHHLMSAHDTPTTMGMGSSQNPWITGELTSTLPSMGHLSSPTTPGLGNALPNAIGSTASVDGGFEGTRSSQDGARPSTPNAQQSSLPTPDFTMSIKSFGRLISPSPEPLWRRDIQPGLKSCLSKSTRRRSKHNTQRRVHFESVPDNESPANEDDSCIVVSSDKNDEDFIEASLPKRRTRHPIRTTQPPMPRAASPPPMASLKELPSEVDKFQGHYAAMAGKGTAGATRAPQRLLPTASQQFLGSPAVEAMADRFIETDEQMRGMEDSDARVMEAESSPAQAARETEKVDDVSAVLMNLDDFLNAWDVDAELAQQARAPQPRGAWGSSPTERIGMGMGIDVNMWQ